MKNVPAEHDTASLRTLFSRYGRVLKILPDPKRRIVTYVVREGVEGGRGEGGREEMCVSEERGKEGGKRRHIFSVIHSSLFLCPSIWMWREEQRPSTTCTAKPSLRMADLSLLNSVTRLVPHYYSGRSV